MYLRGPLLIVAAAVLAVAAWPAFINGRVDAVRAAAFSTPAPVTRDYAQRDSLVAFWEGAVRERHTNDMFSPRQLAAQYLARYREKGDIDDVFRAQQMAERSLAIMPRNVAAIGERAAVMLTLHRFREALHDIDELVPYDPGGPEFLAQKASLQMELGEYTRAAASLHTIRAGEQQNVATQTIQSRYDEITGNLQRARELLDDAMAQVDAHIDEPAQARAWYHFRAGELAFEAGDNSAAIGDEQAALALFPTYNLALKDLAKFELANRHYREALDAAIAGVRVTPFPETLGYEADAQAALGDARGAKTTRNVIFAIERIGNAYHVNDRLLAIYYADHHIRAADALAIARREAAVRGDEIYAQDTLAWAAAMDDRWDEARRAAAKAIRFDTQDPIVQYHAGIIALHFGRRDEGKRRLQRALDLNPQFHLVYADDARRRLAQLQ
jgi:tetratricopeptide (TPR) repeat protein